jgi:hypothetical protein
MTSYAPTVEAARVVDPVTVENVGGEIDAITGQRCTFMIFPWRWPGGDGSGVRVVAVVDPDQSFRIERGQP